MVWGQAKWANVA